MGLGGIGFMVLLQGLKGSTGKSQGCLGQCCSHWKLLDHQKRLGDASGKAMDGQGEAQDNQREASQEPRVPQE